MESSLHRQLKELYAPSPEHREVVWDRWRIDAVRDNELIEIQHGSLSAIRDKIRDTGALCVFSEPQFEPRLVATVVEGHSVPLSKAF